MAAKNGKAKDGGKGRPTREAAARAAVEWANRVNDTLLALMDMLDAAREEAGRAGSPFAEFLSAAEIGAVRQSVEFAWSTAAELRPQNALGITFPTPSQLLKRGGAK